MSRLRRILDSLLSAFLAACKWAFRLRRPVLGASLYAGYILAILSIVVIFCLSLTKSQLSLEMTPSGFPKFVSEHVFAWWTGSTSIDLKKHNEILWDVLGVIVASATLLLGIVPPIDFYFRRREILRRAPLREIKLHRDGEQLEIMDRHYRGASEVILCSGDFSFVTNNPSLLECVQGLSQSGRIKLLSYKPQPTVRGAIGNETIFEGLKPHFQFDFPVKIKLSLIKYPSENLILYYDEKPAQADSAKREKAIYVVRDNNQGRYLISVIQALFEGASAPRPELRAPW